MKIHAWNTGRKYTRGGQKMAATIVNGLCSWVDVSRGLEGSFMARRMGGEGYTEEEVKSNVMYLYDRSLGSGYIPDTEVREALEKAAKEVEDA
jgi:hypothetical protein